MRALRRALAGAAALAALAACIILTAWAVTRLLSDRLVWTQMASWVPSLAFGAAAAVFLGAAELLARAHGPRTGPGSRPGRPARGLRRMGAAGLAIVAVYVAWVELRLWNAVRPPAAPPGSTARLLNWNLTTMKEGEEIASAVAAQGADIAVLVNGSFALPWREMTGTMGLEHGASMNMITVASRWPVLRYGGCHLGVPPPDADPHTHKDPGRAMYVELDTTERLGRPIVVWVIDLPSDERLGRWEVARRARGVIEAWRGPEIVAAPAIGPGRAGAAGGFAPAPLPGAFPAPDVLVGDFNIPRGSASLSLLTDLGGRRLRNAFDAAGWGWCATYPRERPLVHIDQAFVGRAVRAVRYRAVDPGLGRHRAQVVDLAPAD